MIKSRPRYNSLPMLRRSSLFPIIALFTVIASFGAGSHAASDSPAQFERCWSVAESDRRFTLASSGNELVIGATDDAKLVAIESHEGKKLWSTDLGGGLMSGIASTGDMVFVVTGPSASGEAGPMTLRAVKTQTGVPTWVADLPGGGASRLLSISGVVIASTELGDISAFSAVDGRLLWRFRMANGISAIAAIDDRSLVLASGSRVTVLSPATGEAVATIETSFTEIAVVDSMSSGDVLVGDSSGRLASLSRTDGKRLWQLRLGGKVSGSIRIDGGLIVSSHDNFVYRIDASGHVAWKRRMDGRIVCVERIGGDNLVVVSLDSRRGILLNLRNGRSTSQIELPTEPDGASVAAIGPASFSVALGGEIVSYAPVCDNKRR